MRFDGNGCRYVAAAEVVFAMEQVCEVALRSAVAASYPDAATADTFLAFAPLGNHGLSRASVQSGPILRRRPIALPRRLTLRPAAHRLAEPAC
jgi:hypothetical protein